MSGADVMRQGKKMYQGFVFTYFFKIYLGGYKTPTTCKTVCKLCFKEMTSNLTETVNVNISHCIEADLKTNSVV